MVDPRADSARSPSRLQYLPETSELPPESHWLAERSDRSPSPRSATAPPSPCMPTTDPAGLSTSVHPYAVPGYPGRLCLVQTGSRRGSIDPHARPRGEEAMSGIAGIVAKTASAPMDRIKIIFQTINSIISNPIWICWSNFRAFDIWSTDVCSVSFGYCCSIRSCGE